VDRLRQLLAGIGKSLSALTLTQRLLIGALVTIAGLVLLVTVMISARPVMVELMPGATQEELTRAQAALDQAGITTSSSAGKLLVRTEDQYRARARLAEGGALPGNTALLFDSLIAQQNWMASKSEHDRNYNIALQNELARTILSFRGIERASVFIDAPEPIGLGMAYRKPTAAVNVMPSAGRGLDASLVDAIAGLVAGARAGLSVADVRVIDAKTGRQFRARSESDMQAGDYLDHVAKVETRVQEKLLDALRYIPGVIVAVNASVDLRRASTSTRSMLPVSPTGGSLALPSRERTTNSTTGGAGGAAEPGVRSNVQDDIARGGGGSARSNDEQTETEFQIAVGSKQQEILDPRGMPTRVNVTINVPREHIAALIRTKGGDEKAEVKPEDLETNFTTERDRIAKDLQPLVESTVASVDTGKFDTTPGTVTVSMIPVPMLGAGQPVAMAGLVSGGGAAGGGGVMGSVQSMVGQGLVGTIALGALALVAVGLMFSLVRNASKPVELPTPQELVGLPPALETGSDLVGEADESQTAMEGIELPEDTLKTKKMLEQVGEMVKKNPQEAAGLLNRWIQTEQ
jgi:flagellar M-ring protein FliF